ncbi:hypothetical protein EJB05_43634, partial [Eragrostis curvula]
MLRLSSPLDCSALRLAITDVFSIVRPAPPPLLEFAVADDAAAELAEGVELWEHRRFLEAHGRALATGPDREGLATEVVAEAAGALVHRRRAAGFFPLMGERYNHPQLSSDTMGWKKSRGGEALAKKRALRLSMQEKADEE